jgi:hypothetical protein
MKTNFGYQQKRNSEPIRPEFIPLRLIKGSIMCQFLFALKK